MRFEMQQVERNDIGGDRHEDESLVLLQVAGSFS
jgi:hypothetical protein